MKINSYHIIPSGSLVLVCFGLIVDPSFARPIGPYPLTYSANAIEYGEGILGDVWASASLTDIQYSASTYDYSYTLNRRGLPFSAQWI